MSTDSTRHRVAVIGGDGIGPEVVAEALKVVAAAGVALETTDFELGAAHYLATGEVLPDATLDELRGFDAILLGAVGPPVGRPRSPRALERGLLLRLRFELDLYVNLRPFVGSPGSVAADSDFVVIRENTEGTYAGEGGFLRKGTPHEVATQGSVNTRMGVERCVRFAFELASRRAGSTSPSSTRRTCSPSPATSGSARSDEVAREYPGVTRDYNHVDAACIYLVEQPDRYDVIVTDNLFGDILTDLAGAVSGGIGFAASANLNPARTGPSLFEPVHGAAHDIAGTGTANPLAADPLGRAHARAPGEARRRRAGHQGRHRVCPTPCRTRRCRLRRPPSPSATPLQKGSEPRAHHPDREDLARRRARRLGQGHGPRAHPLAALRLGRLRGHPRLPDQPGVAVFRLTDHINRLFTSAKVFMIDIPYTADELVEASREVVRVNGLDDGCYLRPIVYLGYGEMGLNPLPCPVSVAIAAWPWGTYLGDEGVANGIRFKVSSWQRHDPNAVPTAAKGTGMYVNSSLAKVEALKAGYDEAVLLASDGRVWECTGENIFVVRDGVIVTPPTSDSAALAGITQDSVQTIAATSATRCATRRSSAPTSTPPTRPS